MKAGYYFLTENVNNPRPDRRSKRLDSVPVWKAGLRVKVKPHDNEQRGGIVEFSDGCWCHYSIIPHSDDDFNVGNELVSKLEAAPLQVGQFLKDCWATPKQLIAAAVEEGWLSVDKLKQLDDKFYKMSDEEVQAFDQQHWI